MIMQSRKQYNSISFKISVLVAVATLVMVTLLITYSVSRLRRTEIDAAQANALAQARDYSGRLKAIIEEPLDASRTFSSALLSTRDREWKSSLSREDVNGMLKNFIARDTAILGAYTLWEPNAFDGRDSLYAGTAGHDRTGRFIPYWVRTNGKIVLEPLVDYQTEGAGNYYLLPKQTLQETVVDPYLYPIAGKQVLMMSLTTPIVHQGQFLGITGADISLEWLQSMVDASRQEIFNGAGQLSIISNNGTIAAATGRKSSQGSKITGLDQSRGGDMQTGHYTIEGDTLKAYAPLYFGHATRPWQICITVPLKELTKNARAEMIRMILLGAVFLAACVGVVLLLLKKLLNPILQVATVAEEVAQGNLDIAHVDTNSQEIEKLNESFSKVVQSQRDITQVCVAITRGDFSRKAEVKSGKDELAASVNQMIDNLKRAAEEDARRNWSAEGMAKFGELLRLDQGLPQLAGHLLSHLVRYVKANQGALFVVNDADKNAITLDMLACYAYDRKKYLEKSLQAGQGLLGQCYLEKDVIYLTDVPGAYVRITSGLGEATPTSVLIVPMLNNGTVEGLLELASFNPFLDFEIAFIRKLAENIASAIAALKVNERTRRLLEESQQQAEELRAQEEEIRQNMEEMNATHEEIRRKEVTYLRRIEELEATLSARQFISLA
jgi:methyl-accepting chemotaxis protein